jgi:hypothetical protein
VELADPVAQNGIPGERFMNTKFLVFLAWMFNLALRQTADDFWLFCLIYASVLATCTFFFKLENKSKVRSKKTKTQK